MHGAASVEAAQFFARGYGRDVKARVITCTHELKRKRKSAAKGSHREEKEKAKRREMYAGKFEF